MGSDFRPRFLLALVTLSVLLLFCTGAWAQGVGELTGLVTDPTGAIVPKAQVKLVNNSTAVTYATQTSQSGVYRFPSLPIVGTYTLTIDHKGFKSVKVAGIIASVGTVLTRDIKLEIGQAGEVVNVEAMAETVQTSESQMSQLIPSMVWATMPNSTRDSNALIGLVAGSVPNASARGASVNGTRAGSGNFLVEGIDNNDQGMAGAGVLGDTQGGAIASISPEAIQEYRVITNSFAAEYGKAGGFVADTVLKSGTNKMHGSLFEYNRVQALAANDFFSNRTEDIMNPGHKVQDSLVRNQFGGSIGGPVVKDKTFFFLSSELNRRRSASVLSATATTPDFMNWVNSGAMQSWAENSTSGICNNQDFWDNNFIDSKGNQLPGWHTAAPCPGTFAGSAKVGALFNAMSAKSPFPLGTSGLNAGPCASGNNDNCIGEGFYTGGLLYPVPLYSSLNIPNPQHLNEYRISGKFDHKFSDRDQFSAMYLLQDDEFGDPFDGGGNTIGPAYFNQGRTQNIGATWNHSFSPTVLNSFKVGYLRHISNFPETAPGMPEMYTYYDNLSVGLGMYGGLPQYFTDNQFQFQDHLSFVRGKHNFKTGWEIRRTRNGSSFYNGNKGSVYPWSVEDFVTDLNFTDAIDQIVAANGGPRVGSGVASASVDMTTGQQPDVYRGFRALELAGYFQDDFRVNSRLTLNYGVRWEYFGPPHNFKPGIDSNMYFGTTGTPIGHTYTTAKGTFTSTNPYFPAYNPYFQKVATGTFQIRDHEIWNKDTNNFGPRFGLAYDVLGNQKLVFRMGGGIMYDRMYNNIFENIRFNPPHFSNNQIGSAYNGVPVGALNTPGLLTYPFTSNSMFASPLYAAVPNPRHMDQNTVAAYNEQAHAGFQWEFARGFVFEPEYVGTFGHKLLAYRDINTFDGRTAYGTRCRTSWSLPGASASDFNACRPNINVGADNYRSNDYSSNYHALQMTVRKNYGHGLQFSSSYTYSKAMDTISDLFYNRNSATVTDPQNIKSDYGPADFNLTHRWVTNFTYEVPFAKNNRFMGGWTLSSMINFQTGTPFSPYSSSSSYDLNKNGLATDRVIPAAGAAPGTTILPSLNYSPTGAQWGDPVGYFAASSWVRATCPTSVNGGKWCDAPIRRNTMTGPGQQNVDLGIAKKFKVTEGSSLQFQANFFNLLNHTNFSLPHFNQNGANFGAITAATNPRQTQLALRFDF